MPEKTRAGVTTRIRFARRTAPSQSQSAPCFCAPGTDSLLGPLPVSAVSGMTFLVSRGKLRASRFTLKISASTSRFGF